MNFLRAIIAFIMIVAVALGLGWSEDRVRHHVSKGYLWIGGIAVLLLVRWFL